MENQLIRKEEIVKMSTVPTNFINPSSLLNGKPLITREDIFEAMSRTAFSTLTSDDSFIYNIVDKVNAEKDAIEFAVKNKIDINKMFSKIIGTITLPDVIEEFEINNPKNIICKTELTNIMFAAIEDKNKQQLSEYYVRAKTSKIDSSILKEAKKLLKEIPDIEETPEEPVPEPVVVVKAAVNKNIYSSSRRR